MTALDAIYAENVQLRAAAADAKRRLDTLIGVLTGEAPQFYRVAGLTRTEARIVGLVAAAGVVKNAALFDAIWPNSTYEDAANVIAVHMRRIRLKLEKHGVAIRNVHGVGYEMRPDDVAKLEGLV